MRHHFQPDQNNRADRPSVLPYLDQLDSQARKLQACLKPLAINDHLGQNSRTRPLAWGSIPPRLAATAVAASPAALHR